MLTPGARLGPYEVVSPLGAGGMGEVFKARDTRLDRSVAIKVLPTEFAQNAQLKLRFEREAKAISQLSHPNICTLYDVGDGYLVMELLEGETLADRLSRGPLPLDQVIRIGTEIANALDRAHKAGIVHRDLKPSNVMLTKSGAKLLDFGLASTKAIGTPEASGLATMQKLTEEGTLLGTFQYMAPEQLEGGDVDARTDIFALGAVLYEMATGRRAFEGKSKASVIAAILSGEPPRMSAVQPLTPVTFEEIVAKALAKDPDERWQSAADLGWELQHLQRDVPAAKRGGFLPWIVAALAIAVAIGAVVLLRSREPRPALTRFMFDVPPGWVALPETKSGPPAISPDGRSIVFVAAEVSSGRRSIWLRRIDSVTPVMLEGTEEGSRPFWSPDSKSIGFFSSNNNKLKRLDLAAGPPRILCDAQNGRGGTWGADGTIVFTNAPIGPTMRVDARGGVARPATKLLDHEYTHRWPSFLPDGKRFFFVARGGVPGATDMWHDRVYVSDLASGERKFVMESISDIQACRPGWIVYLSDRTLFAQKFDFDKLEVSGEPTVIASRVAFHASGFGMFSVSPSTLVYQSGFITARIETLDRGTDSRTAITDTAAEYATPRFSPDESQILYTAADPATGFEDVWLFDRARKISRRMTTSAADDFSSIVSPDGASIFLTSNRTGTPVIYQKAIDGGQERVLFPSQTAVFAQDISRDGRTLLYVELGPSNNDIWAWSLAEGKRTPIATSTFDEVQPVLSKDSRYVAFVSNESGRYEVYVAPFPAASPHIQISTDGGTQPAWRADGRELYYIGPAGKLTAVPIETGAKVKVGVPSVIATVSLRPSRNSMREYEPSADGKSFIINSTGHDIRSVPFTVVSNWQEGLPKP